MKQTSQVTKMIIEYMTLNGFKVWRQNNTRATRNRTFTGEYGLPDIIGFRKSDALFAVVEIKIGKDKLSDKQEGFLADVVVANGLAIVAQDSFEDFQRKFIAWMALDKMKKKILAL